MFSRYSHAFLVFAVRPLAICAVSATMALSSTAQTTTATGSSSTVNQGSTQSSPPDKQTNAEKAKPAATVNPPKRLKIGKLDFSGSLRLRVEHYSWWETPGFEDSYTFGAAVLRLSLGEQKECVDWKIEGEFPVVISLPERAVAPAPQGPLGLGASYFAANGKGDGSAVMKQAYIGVKRLFGDKPSSLRIGRFEFIDGAETIPADGTLGVLKRDSIAQRLIGPFGATHVGRSFDGVQYVHNTKHSNFTFVGGRPTEGVFQLRSLRELDVDFWYGAYTKPITREKAASEFRFFTLHYHDGRGALKTDNRSAVLRRADIQNIRITSYGGNYIEAIRTREGTFDLVAWGVGQKLRTSRDGTLRSATINTAFGTSLQATVKESGNNQKNIPVTFTPLVSGASGTFTVFLSENVGI